MLFEKFKPCKNLFAWCLSFWDTIFTWVSPSKYLLSENAALSQSLQSCPVPEDSWVSASVLLIWDYTSHVLCMFAHNPPLRSTLTLWVRHQPKSFDNEYLNCWGGEIMHLPVMPDQKRSSGMWLDFFFSRQNDLAVRDSPGTGVQRSNTCPQTPHSVPWIHQESSVLEAGWRKHKREMPRRICSTHCSPPTHCQFKPLSPQAFTARHDNSFTKVASASLQPPFMQVFLKLSTEGDSINKEQ